MLSLLSHPRLSNCRRMFLRNYEVQINIGVHDFEKKGEHTKEETKRLAEVQTQLDQCWDLLRQRRALREFGDDPSKAKARSPEVIKKYQA